MHGVAQHGRIDLKPLDNALSQELAEVLLPRIDGGPQWLRTLIVDGAEGNPFYMEELVKMLIDDGAIVVERRRLACRRRSAARARVPQTLTGVLQARLDALAPPERWRCSRRRSSATCSGTRRSPRSTPRRSRSCRGWCSASS